MTEDWMKEFLDVDEGLRIEFEDVVNFTDDTPEDKRYFKLDAIADYADKYGLTEAAAQARNAMTTDEDVLGVLASIGFTFDGKKLSKIDNQQQNIQIMSRKGEK
jgi:hypothetical protein